VTIFGAGERVAIDGNCVVGVKTETRKYMGSKSLIVWLAMTRKINSIAMAHLICYIMWQ
jgi:hypothetical protein